MIRSWVPWDATELVLHERLDIGLWRKLLLVIVEERLGNSAVDPLLQLHSRYDHIVQCHKSVEGPANCATGAASYVLTFTSETSALLGSNRSWQTRTPSRRTIRTSGGTDS